MDKPHHSPSPPDFEPGSLVWLLRRNIPTLRPSGKLDHRRLGPIKILGRVGNSAFRLQLPEHFTIHPVFHVSLLERYIPPDSIPGRPPLPPPHSDDVLFDSANPAFAEVDSVQDSMVKNNRFWYLLRWRNKPTSEDAWKRLTQLPTSLTPLLVAFHKRYPRYRRPPSLDFSPVVPPSPSSRPPSESSSSVAPDTRPRRTVNYASRPNRNSDFHAAVANTSRTTTSGRVSRPPRRDA